MAELSAFGMRRIADMDRGQLIDTINALYTSLLAVNGRTIGTDRTALPEASVPQAEQIARELFPLDAAKA